MKNPFKPFCKRLAQKLKQWYNSYYEWRYGIKTYNRTRD